MTWNIHGALGRNPRFDLDRVVKLIGSHAPDVVALQEIDSRRPRAAGVDDPFLALQQAVGGHGVGAKSIVTADGEYGQALFSRWPFAETEIVDISHPEREPRRAIRAEIDTPCGRLRVVATHLGLSFGERRSQARALLKLIGEGPTPTIAMGDFNDWIAVGSVRNILRCVLPGHSRLRTFPSFYPLLGLDRIYCRPRTSLVQVFTDPSARAISDHLPVIADVSLAALGGG